MASPLDAAESKPVEGGATYPLSHRLFRVVWRTTWFLLASWTPPAMRGWRRFLLRLFGARIASTAGVYGSASIWYPPNLDLGPHAYIGPGANIYCMAEVRIGPYAIISQGAHLCGGTHDVSDPHFQLIARPIHIGERAWIAAEAFVGPGVTVGDGAVLGARGVAMKDLKAWTIYSGNPARALRDRKLRPAGESA